MLLLYRLRCSSATGFREATLRAMRWSGVQHEYWFVQNVRRETEANRVTQGRQEEVMRWSDVSCVCVCV